MSHPNLVILSLEMDSVTRCSTPEHLINRLKQFRGPFRVRKYFEYKVRNSRLSVSEGSFSTQIKGAGSHSLWRISNEWIHSVYTEFSSVQGFWKTISMDAFCWVFFKSTIFRKIYLGLTFINVYKESIKFLRVKYI